MTKEEAHQHIQEHLETDDTLKGFFTAIEPAKLWLFLLIGPLAFLSMKQYFIAVSENGIYFHKMGFFGKFTTHDFFTFKEIENVKIGKGLLQRPMKFLFKNGRSMKIKAQLKGVEKVAKLTEEIQEHLEKNISTI